MPRWFFHPLTVIICTIVITWLYGSLLRTEQNMRTSSETVGVLDQEVSQIASEVSELESRLATAQSPAAQEERIRNELLLKKPGEYVIQLPPASMNSTIETQKRSLSPWEQWQALLLR